FFSSRRRHTRFSRDWSSDVCSSDLLEDLNRVEEYLERLDDEVRSAIKRALIVLQYRLQSIRPIDDLLRNAIDGLLTSGLEGGFEIGRASCRARVCVSCGAVLCT